jgi:hypothetical protein
VKYIAIDETYGPEADAVSSYATSRRRTTVGVLIDEEVVIKLEILLTEMLSSINECFQTHFMDFHFSDIYNRRNEWGKVCKISEGENIRIIEGFIDLYQKFRFPVHIQTIDDRTLLDHGTQDICGRIEIFDLSNREHLSSLFLLMKIKRIYRQEECDFTIIMDEGIMKVGAEFGHAIFSGVGARFSGNVASSIERPILQFADFLCATPPIHSLSLRGSGRRTSALRVM